MKAKNKTNSINNSLLQFEYIDEEYLYELKKKISEFKNRKWKLFYVIIYEINSFDNIFKTYSLF